MMVMKHTRTYMIVINNNREFKIVINIFFSEWHCKSAEGSWFSHRTPPPKPQRDTLVTGHNAVC